MTIDDYIVFYPIPRPLSHLKRSTLASTNHSHLPLYRCVGGLQRIQRETWDTVHTVSSPCSQGARKASEICLPEKDMLRPKTFNIFNERLLFFFQNGKGSTVTEFINCVKPQCLLIYLALTSLKFALMSISLFHMSSWRPFQPNISWRLILEPLQRYRPKKQDFAVVVGHLQHVQTVQPIHPGTWNHMSKLRDAMLQKRWLLHSAIHAGLFLKLWHFYDTCCTKMRCG